MPVVIIIIIIKHELMSYLFIYLCAIFNLFNDLNKKTVVHHLKVKVIPKVKLTAKGSKP